jgi:PhoH-like ATPase
LTYNELVIDTNILLSDGNALKKFGKHALNIPFVVLQELDKHKSSPGEVGLNARTTIKILDELRLKGSLKVGVPYLEGTVRVLLEVEDKTVSPDDQIIKSAVDLNALTDNVIVVSNDINLRVKASLFDLKAQGHSGKKIHIDDAAMFSGIAHEQVEPSVIDQLHAHGHVYLGNEKEYALNEFIHFINKTNDKHTAIGRVIDEGTVYRMRTIKEAYSIRPKNLEQSCALDLLMDIDVPLVTLMGLAGTGKTLIALAAALDLVLNQNQYEKLIIMRPPVPMGKDIGYLPGSLEEKMAVWLGPILDNFDMLMGERQKHSFEYLVNAGKIEVLPPTFIRGRSLAHSILFVDEAQSLSLHEAKTIVTRMHESSKLIMTGDVRQIDNPKLSSVDNGLSIIVDAFKSYDLAGHVTLTKCERGSLAALAAEVL